MKYKPEKKQVSWGITIFVTFLACFAVYGLFMHGSGLAKGFSKLTSGMMSVIYGIVVAFILTPVLNAIEARWVVPVYEKRHGTLSDRHGKSHVVVRRWAVLITMAIFILCLYALIMVVIPQFISSIQTFIGHVPTYIDNVTDWIDSISIPNQQLEQTLTQIWGSSSSQITDFLSNSQSLPDVSEIIDMLTSSVIAFVRGIFNFIIGLIVACYILASKETFCAQGKKIAYAVFRRDTANEVVAAFRFVNITFNGFIIGKIIDSIIIGLLCFAGTAILRTPYPVLVSVIVGVTNIIPFFGPYIGAIVGGVLILLINPMKVIPFVIFVIALQQFDGNVLGPKILGDSTGLSSFWVIFAIMLFGGLFGVIGWIIGVPLFAVVYALIRRIVNHFLRKKGLPELTETYRDLAYFEGDEQKKLSDPDAVAFRAQKPPSAWRKMVRRGKARKAEKDADNKDNHKEEKEDS